MKPSTRPKLVAAAIALVSFALVFPAAGGAPVVPATVAELPTSWAYGANTSTWVNVTNATGNYVGMVHSYFGIQVVLNQTNISSNDTLVELQRTLAFDYEAEYCTPTCTTPNGEINASYTAWQSAVGFVNFTNGTVQTPSGGSVPALAVQDASTHVKGNITERFDTGYRNLLNIWKTGSDYLTVQAAGNLSVAFSPALGLLPLNFTQAPSWDSTSTYSATGDWSASYAWAKDPIFGTSVSGRLSPSGNLASTGTVNVYGYQGLNVVLAGERSTQTAGLTLGGPFTLRDGILFLPAASDVFQSNSGQSWSSYSDASGPASTATINLGARLDHIGLLASTTTFQPVATSSFPTAASPVTQSLGAASPIPAAGNAPYQPTATPQNLQAQPEQVPYATQQSNCLSLGSCPGQSMTLPGSEGKKNLFGAAVVVLAVVVIGALIAVGVVSRRRQVPPPPPRSNATLYPAIGPTAAPPPAPPSTPTARPAVPGAPATDDPLGHLW